MTGDFQPGLPWARRLPVGVSRAGGPQQSVRSRSRPGGRECLAPECRGSLEIEERSARGQGGIGFPEAVSRAPCPPAGPQPQIIFLLKSWLHPGIPKTARPHLSLCQADLAPSAAAWQTTEFCPSRCRQALRQKLTPLSPPPSPAQEASTPNPTLLSA